MNELVAMASDLRTELVPHLSDSGLILGRKVEITTADGAFTDRIKAVDGDEISFESHDSLNVSKIKNAIVQIEFKKLDANED